VHRDQLLAIFCNPNLNKNPFLPIKHPCSPSPQFRHALGGDCGICENEITGVKGGLEKNNNPIVSRITCEIGNRWACEVPHRGCGLGVVYWGSPQPSFPLSLVSLGSYHTDTCVLFLVSCAGPGCYGEPWPWSKLSMCGWALPRYGPCRDG